MPENINEPENIDEYERLAQTSRDYVSSLRTLLIKVGERHQLPERFQVFSCADKIAMKIVDTETGRAAEVVLSAYGDVRKALMQLFGPPAPNSTLAVPSPTRDDVE